MMSHKNKGVIWFICMFWSGKLFRNYFVLLFCNLFEDGSAKMYKCDFLFCKIRHTGWKLYWSILKNQSNANLITFL